MSEKGLMRSEINKQLSIIINWTKEEEEKEMQRTRKSALRQTKRTVLDLPIWIMNKHRYVIIIMHMRPLYCVQLL